MESKIESALLVDTCSVYKLYFFVNKVIPEKEILVPALGALEFHPIVKSEFDDDDIEVFIKSITLLLTSTKWSEQSELSGVSGKFTTVR